MTDGVILRVPTGPQYSYFELKLEFETFDQLDGKINDLHNGLLAKLSAAVSTACELAKLEPSAMAQIESWETFCGPSRITSEPKPEPPPTSEDSAETVKRELGATMLAQYKTTAPWDESPPAAETRPAPPWAAAPTPPTPVVKSSVPFDDDF